MSGELNTYKQNKINQLNRIFNIKFARLKSDLTANIAKVNKSVISFRQKQILINQLNAQYNKNINILKTQRNASITNTLNFIPNKINIKNKKALLVGINYTNTKNELNGCISDVESIKERLSTNGFSDITVITDNTTNKPTKNNILDAFKKLLNSSKPNDLLVFTYSGHGSYINDTNNDERSPYDQCIIPLDFDKNGIILDDELKQIIQTHLKPKVTLFALFDSCFSGSVLDLRYQFMDSLNYDKFTENDKADETQSDVFMISGCTDTQTSVEAFINNKPNGAMTWSLLESLKQKPNCTWRELIKNMRSLLKTSNYNQIPQFSCGQFENIDSEIFI
jgi:hypothetical protein